VRFVLFARLVFRWLQFWQPQPMQSQAPTLQIVPGSVDMPKLAADAVDAALKGETKILVPMDSSLEPIAMVQDVQDEVDDRNTVCSDSAPPLVHITDIADVIEIQFGAPKPANRDTADDPAQETWWTSSPSRPTPR
jgi:hypothetical protein